MCFRQIMGLLPEKHKRIPTGPSKIDNPEKLATQGTQDEEKQRRRKKPNTICIGNHYAQANTNNVNKT